MALRLGPKVRALNGHISLREDLSITISNDVAAWIYEASAAVRSLACAGSLAVARRSGRHFR